MVFNDTVTNLGICQEVDDLCDSDTTSYSLAKKTRRANTALETLISKIINADGTWQFDDTNYTTLPIGVGNLVSGQNSYTFASDFLDLEEVDILDLSGVYRRIFPFDPSELNMSFEQYFNISTSTTPTGIPLFYDKQGDSIRLVPAPSATYCTLTNGLKIRFKRTGSLFTAADTTKEPGIASPYHIIVAWMMALPYCKTYKKDRVQQLELDIATETRNMLDYYSKREKDARKIMRMKDITYR